MTRLVVSVSEQVSSQLTQRATAAGYATAEAYVEALLLADAADPGAPAHLSIKGDAMLESFLLQRVASPDLGSMSADTFESIRQRVRTTSNRAH